MVVLVCVLFAQHFFLDTARIQHCGKYNRDDDQRVTMVRRLRPNTALTILYQFQGRAHYTYVLAQEFRVESYYLEELPDLFQIILGCRNKEVSSYVTLKPNLIVFT